jgi:hypothetical protein
MGLFDIDPSGFSLSGRDYNFDLPDLTGGMGGDSLANVASQFSLGDLGGAGGSTLDARNFSFSAGDAAPSWYDNLGALAGKVTGWDSGKGWLDNLGSVAKAVTPFATLGGGIFSAYNQLQAQQDAAKAGKLAREAQGVQLANAKQAGPMAQEAMATSRLNEPLAQRTEAISPLVRTGVTDPVLGYADERLRGAMAGEIPPAIEAGIQRWGQAAKAQMLTYLAKSGQSESSARYEMERAIDEQMEAKRGEYLQSTEKAALGAYQQGQAGYAGEADINRVAAGIRGQEVAGMGTAGNILQGATAGAGNVAQQANAERALLAKLINDINQNLSKVLGAAAPATA